ncbi:unnamed protein product [Pleuronectes platessa]|uniref:CBM21 domain-containing protein n=1 Tax=Pleuronectes platessa TaxID=8262 RepID=A0A9N7XZX7_PLEPL|nr:unnamed protein product [Pleuronectes platessa]
MTGPPCSSYTCPINRSGSGSQCSAVTELHLSSHVPSALSPPQYHCSRARGTLVCATLPATQTAGRGRQLPLRPPSIMEALCVRPLKEDGVVTEEEERERCGGQEEGGREASSPTGSTTDEDTDEDSEPEPPSVVCRKVSFADAFGLNLVSVKEFDNVEATGSEVSRPPERDAAFPLEEFYMSCLFTVPSSPEELDQRLRAQMLELESIELLPGTTMLRGTIRVVNLGYSKSVYARISLDCWSSYFDLLAEYVPGSSDRETDRFAFKYSLIPPFDREGTRVDFCLRYETTAGTFWANNKEINYVLFCHQRGQAKELGPQVLEESGGYKGKRSCLKAKRRISAEEKTKESNNTATPSAGAQVPHKAQEAERQSADSTETHSLLHHEGHKALVDGVKSWPRGVRLARVQEDPSQRRQARRVYSHDSAGCQKITPPGPAPWCDHVSNRYNRQKKPNDTPPVLTYHQIPLLTLDWKSDTPQRWGAADMDDIWAGNAKQTRPKASVENIEATPSVNDLWETFLHGAVDTGDKDTSAGHVWQEFLNEPSHQDHSGVPEAEWLQTAASVSPSNHRGPKCSARSHAFREVPMGTDAPTASETTSSNSDHQPNAEACVCDNTLTRGASQRSQTNSVTHTLEECSLQGVRPVSGGSVDSSAACHMLPTWKRAGKRGEAEGAGGDERVAPLAADLVTSSGESKTADMTEMPESQNASAVDRISQRARLDEGLSSRGEGEGTETAGGIMTNRTENQASTEEKLFRPLETGACEMSPRNADEKRSEDFGLNPKSENPLMENEGDENEIRPEQSHAHKFNPNQTCEENIRPSAVLEGGFKLDGSEKDLSDKDQEGFRQLKSPAWQRGDASLVSEVHNKQLRTIRAAEELLDGKEEEKNLRKSEETEGKESLSCSGTNVERQEINPSAQITPNVEIKVLHSDTSPAETHVLNPTEVEGLRLKSSQDVMRDRREGAGRETSPEEITLKENIDAETEPRHQPATLARSRGGYEAERGRGEKADNRGDEGVDG